MLPPSGSVTPLGLETVAVLVMFPVAFDGKDAVRVKVAEPPFARLTVVLMLPVPLALPQLDPLDAAHVQETLPRMPGTVSVTVAPVTGLGPSLVTVIVYVNCVPGIGCVGVAVLVIRRFESEMTLSVSLAVLLPVLGSVEPAGAETLAVFVNVPSASSATLAVSVKVALPPDARLTVVLMLPMPLVAPQLEPLEVKQVQLALVNFAGSVSTTGAPVTALGPALETSRV